MTNLSSHPLIAHHCLLLTKFNQRLEGKEAQVTQLTKVILPDQGRDRQRMDLRQKGEGSRMGRELPAHDKRQMGKLTVIMEVKHPRRQVSHPDTWDASLFFNI